MDQIIEMMKVKYPGVEVFYSTFGEYFKQVADEKVEWPIYEQDFFP